MVLAVTKNNTVSSLMTNGASTVNEPSVASSGDVCLYTGNWYAGYSTDGGSSWTSMSPYSHFPAVNNGFCCDQSLIHAPQIDNFFWLLQYSEDASSNTLRVANCLSSNVATNGWTYLDLVPGQINPAWNGEWFDYNHIALSDNYLYVGTNMFYINGGFSRSVIFRMKLASFVDDGDGFVLEYFESPDLGSLRCVMGATDTMYFASHRYNDLIEVFAWPESSPSPSMTQVSISAWNWGNAYYANTAGAPNWMGRLTDGRITAGFNTDNEIGFAWSAPVQDGRKNPFVRCVVIDKGSMTLKRDQDIWHDDYAFGWPEMCPDNSGTVGVSLFVSSNSIHPSHAVGTLNNVTSSWNLSLTNRGIDTAASGTWGDYIHMRPLNGQNGWVTSGYTMQGGNQTTNVDPRYIEFV